MLPYWLPSCEIPGVDLGVPPFCDKHRTVNNKIGISAIIILHRWTKRLRIQHCSSVADAEVNMLVVARGWAYRPALAFTLRNQLAGCRIEDLQRRACHATT